MLNRVSVDSVDDFNKLSENQKLIYETSEIINKKLSGKKLNVIKSILITCIRDLLRSIEDTEIRKLNAQEMLNGLIKVIEDTK